VSIPRLPAIVGRDHLLQPVHGDPQPRSVAVRPSLWSRWLWGCLAVAQLVLDLVLAVPYLLVVSLLVIGAALVPVLFVGVPILALALLLAMALGPFERARLQAFTGAVVAPRRPRPRSASAGRWQLWLRDSRPWRAALHLLAISLWGMLAGTITVVLAAVALALVTEPLYQAALPGGMVTMPWNRQIEANWGFALLGLFMVTVVPLVAHDAVRLDVLLVRSQLGEGRSAEVERLEARVETLTHSREATVDSVEGERRRIERDLHDGPQQRLVAIAMDLGMARAKLDVDPDGARELIDKAHQASKDAVTELRQVARGIHPPVLTDRGLDAALSALAARSAVPVTVRVDLPRRPTPTTEAIAYFCVSEALTNVAKHAGASQVTVDVGLAEGNLVAVVADDGCGGADPDLGTGLSGLRQRAAAVDGVVDLESPPGGGTRLTVRLPMSPDRPTDEPPDRSQS